jgi:hypothetical protein
MTVDTYYIEYLNKDNNHQLEKKYFTGTNAYSDCVEWGKKNLENFNMDMVRMERSSAYRNKW